MRSLFTEFVENHNPQEPVMPLIHSTCGFYFQNILLKGKISKITCPVFKEDYVYLFYGRPAYKVSPKVDSCTISELLPVCFLFKPNVSLNFVNIFPFDSGAFQNGCYKQVISTMYPIEEFSLGNNIDNVQKLISAFFGNNSNYYTGIINENMNKPNCMQVEAYSRLIKTDIPIPADDRKYTVEIIVNQDIELLNNIISIVLPRQLLLYDSIEQILESNKIDYRTYPTINGLQPNNYNYEILKVVNEILEEKNYL